MNGYEERLKKTKWMMEDRFGMFIHWGLYAIPARGEWVRSIEKISVEEYQQFFDMFNPTKYEPKKWAKLAKRAGMKYMGDIPHKETGMRAMFFIIKNEDYKVQNFIY